MPAKLVIYFVAVFRARQMVKIATETTPHLYMLLSIMEIFKQVILMILSVGKLYQDYLIFNLLLGAEEPVYLAVQRVKRWNMMVQTGFVHLVEGQNFQVVALTARL